MFLSSRAWIYILQEGGSAQWSLQTVPSHSASPPAQSRWIHRANGLCSLCVVIDAFLHCYALELLMSHTGCTGTAAKPFETLVPRWLLLVGYWLSSNGHSAQFMFEVSRPRWQIKWQTRQCGRKYIEYIKMDKQSFFLLCRKFGLVLHILTHTICF